MSTARPDTRSLTPPRSARSSTPSPLTLPISIAAAALLFAGMLLRFYAATFQLWLDEIWALDASRTLNSISALFNSPLLNGHFSLYTLWLSFFPSETDPLMLRAPSLLCAAVQLYATWHLAHRWWGARTALLALGISAISFFFLVYATEARAYAVVGAVGPLMLIAAERYHTRTSAGWAAVFAALFVFGTLFHLSIVPFYLFVGLYSVVTMCSHHGLVRGVWRTLGLHALPIGAFTFLYAIKLRGLGEGSGPVMEYGDVAIDTLSMVAGGPLVSPENPGQTVTAAVLALTVATLLGRSLWRLVRERDPRAMLLTGIVIGIPVLVMAMAPRILLPRYLYLSVLGALLVLSREIVSLWERNPRYNVGKGCALVLAAVLIVLNLSSSLRFLRNQRGDLRGAIATACTLGTGPEVKLSGNHRFRDESMIAFFAPKVCARPVRYVPLPDASDLDALLVQSQDTGHTPRSAITHRGVRYSLVAQYPYAGLSGWSWYLYAPSAEEVRS